MEPFIALGGGRALLLQVLHPLVAAGVEQHSNFTEDPFARGVSTIDVMLKLAFGDPATSKRQADLLRRIHSPMASRTARSTRICCCGCGRPSSTCPCGCTSSPSGPSRGARWASVNGTTRSRSSSLMRAVSPPARVLERSPTSTGTWSRRSRRTCPSHPLPSPARERVLRALLFALRLQSRVVPATLRHAPNRYLIRRKTPLRLWRGRSVRLPDALQPPPAGG